jgi:hypothetical protein
LITAQQIDATTEWLNGFSESESEALIDKFDAAQPDILGYVMSEEAEELGEEEAELLLFMAATLWQVAVRNSKTPVEMVSAEELDDLQDANWAEFDDLEQKKDQSFAEFVDAIIEAYPEPELLHYVTDVFTEDEDDEFAIEEAAKLPMFVMLKTVADALFL